ncbi:tail fiber protein [Magnetovibrio sp. PR-2]|uniref:phage tail protein n=1 Tax=Magnetovibrio sp. PR-2 TaxID=3120356 RepID=UPI002FCE06A9
MKSTHTFKTLSIGLGVLTLALIGDVQTNQAHATCATDPYIGSVCATAANYCPRGYIPLHGQLMTISSDTTLFSLLGTTFGGDGRTTFGVPDMRGRSMVGSGEGPGLSMALLGQRRGYERVTPSELTMATHSHSATFVPSSSGGSDVEVTLNAATNTNPDVKTPTTGSFIAQAGTGFSAAESFVSSPTGTVELGGVEVSGGGSSGGAVVVDENGGGQSTINVPPQLVLTFCMAAQGTYPPRN